MIEETMDQPISMWPYWRDKYGFVQALIDYYPNKLNGHIMLQQALYQAQAAETFIEGFMSTAMIKESSEVSD